MVLTRLTVERGLSEFRDKHGLTLDKVSDETGVAVSTLIAIEKGQSSTQAATISKLNKYIKTVEPCTEAM